jgi:hypothetical protein
MNLAEQVGEFNFLRAIQRAHRPIVNHGFDGGIHIRIGKAQHARADGSTTK